LSSGSGYLFFLNLVQHYLDAIFVLKGEQNACVETSISCKTLTRLFYLVSSSGDDVTRQFLIRRFLTAS